MHSMHLFQDFIGLKIPLTLPNSIKEKRLRMGLTQTSLANKIGKSPRKNMQYVLSRLESGKTKKITNDICIICTFIDIDLKKHFEAPEQCLSDDLSMHIQAIWSSDPKRAIIAFEMFKKFYEIL